MTMQADFQNTLPISTGGNKISPAFQKMWPAVLALAAIGSSWALACVTPFAGFALVTSRTLPLKTALGTVAAIWLANQAVGFLFLSYPLTADCFMWGAAMGAASLAATLASIGVMRLRLPTPVTLVAGLAAAFVVYEGGLLALALLTGGTEAFTLPIIGHFLLSNVLWSAGLLAAHEIITRLVASKVAVRTA